MRLQAVERKRPPIANAREAFGTSVNDKLAASAVRLRGLRERYPVADLPDREPESGQPVGALVSGGISKQPDREAASGLVRASFASTLWLGASHLEVEPVDVLEHVRVGDVSILASASRLLPTEQAEAATARLAAARESGRTRGRVKCGQSAASLREQTRSFGRWAALASRPGLVPVVGVSTYGREWPVVSCVRGVKGAHTCGPDDRCSKYQVNRMRGSVRRWHEQHGIERLDWWGNERQKRGAPHFNHAHALPKPLVRAFERWYSAEWLRITGYGESDPYWRERKGTVWMLDRRQDSPGATMQALATYFAKEVSKRHQKRFDESPGRWFGGFRVTDCGRPVKPRGQDRPEPREHSGPDCCHARRLRLAGFRENRALVAPEGRAVFARRLRRISRELQPMARVMTWPDRVTGEVRERLMVRQWWIGRLADGLMYGGRTLDDAISWALARGYAVAA